MRLAPTLALVLLTGCASMFGTGAPSPEFSRAYGCDHDAVLAQRKDRGEPRTPRVGWTACELLVRYGAPRRADVDESRYGRSARWWYPDLVAGMNDPRLVALEREGGVWRVVYVSGW